MKTEQIYSLKMRSTGWKNWILNPLRNYKNFLFQHSSAFWLPKILDFDLPNEAAFKIISIKRA